jgi:hypothetical protein
MPKISRPVLYTVIAAIGVTAWVMTSEETPVSTGKKTPRLVKKTTKASGTFTEEDFNVSAKSFGPTVKIERNSFDPLVVRTRSGADFQLMPDQVPAELAGGDPNWVYTGTAEIDGKPTALLENRVTLESDFVNQGDKWQRTTISQILPQGIVLAGPSGKKVRLTMNNGEVAVVGGSERFAAGFQPVTPSLRGPIGANGISVRPDRVASRNTNVEERDAN